MEKRSTIWIDAAGITRQTIMSTVAGGAAIEASMLAVSNAARQDEWEGTAGGSVGVPASSTFETVADYALLYYACGDGTIASLTVPAPSYAIFLADGSTVDATNAGIVALNGDAIGALLSASGSAAVSFIGGRRQRNNRDY